MHLEFDRNALLGPRRFTSYFCPPHDTATLFARVRCVSPMKSTRAPLGAANMLAAIMNNANAVRMAAQ
jgi:hypothetical protein